jgi:hypothetical protein
MKVSPYPLLGLAALALTGCPKDDKAVAESRPEGLANGPKVVVTASAAAAAVTSAAPVASASASAAVPDKPPACRVSAEKVWAKGANRLTGLTHLELADGRIAIGMAIGNSPHTLLIGKGGHGKFEKLKIPEKSDLATPMKPGEGERQLLRVTPIKVEGDKVVAFADHKEIRKDKSRRVTCGPAEIDGEWIGFDGTPLLDREDKPSDDDKKKLFAKREADADEGYHELRECRSFADHRTGEPFIIGSELWATQQPDDKLAWKTSLVIDTGANTHEKHLKEFDLKGEPPKIVNFEVPQLYRLEDKRFVLTVRHGGSLMVGVLNSDRSLHGGIQSYAGMPTRPEISEDGDDLVLTTSIVKDKGWQLRALRLSMKDPKPPKALSPIITDEDDKESKSDPDFTVDTKGRRWLTFIEGERGKGALMIAPIDRDFKVIGRAYEIAPKEAKVAEARLNAFSDGVVSVIMLREEGGSLELVSQDLSCDVLPK